MLDGGPALQGSRGEHMGTKRVLMTAVLGLAGLMAIPASAQYYPSNNRGNWGWQDRQ